MLISKEKSCKIKVTMKNNFKSLFCIIIIVCVLAFSGCDVKTSNTSSDLTDIVRSDAMYYESNSKNESLISSSNLAESSEPKNPSSSQKVNNSSNKSSQNQTTSLNAISTSNNISSSSIISSSELQSSSSAPPSSSEPNVIQQTPSKNDGFSLRGIWISCFEMPFKSCKTKEDAKEKFGKMIKSVANQGYNAVFCHVRPFADAFYPSNYFPFSKYVSGTEGVDPGFDALQIMIDCAKAYGLEFHAWINPYRVSTSTTNADDLSKNNIAKKWLTDDSNRAVVSGNGIYFNPAEPDVQNLILSGISEIINNYKVDGVHFDDYFYPTTNKAFDNKAYSDYLSKNSENPLSLGDWRRENVNTLVKKAYTLCKNKNLVFGVSPSGNISLNKTDKNYTKHYADVTLWMQTEGYVDYIIPQIYFGYNHTVPTAQYMYLLDIWSSLPRHDKLKLYIGLGAYKMDEDCTDKEEWHNDSTLLSRQTIDAKNKGANGIVVFSYSASVNSKNYNQIQIKNMFNTIDLS
jgi:uncharacterized lipoprotein YddW (UPF0748 family)